MTGQTSQTQQTLCEILLAVYEHNKLLSTATVMKIKSEALESKNSEAHIFNALVSHWQGDFDDVVGICIDNNLFTKEEFLGLSTVNDTVVLEIKREPEYVSDSSEVPETEKDPEIVVHSEISEEDGNNGTENAVGTQESVQPEKPAVKAADPLPAKKAPKAAKKDGDTDPNEEYYAAALTRTESFTEEEIRAMMAKGVNLYKAVPWRLVPRKDNRFYADVQLYRFVDAKASDFLFHTHKKWGNIWYQIQFMINGESETQDESKPDHFKNENDTSENFFFATVRKFIGSKGIKNPDKKHVAADWRFSLEYRGMRDFRINAAPVKCYDAYFPKYVIRLASEADNIRLSDLYMLPFVSEQYQEMVHGKQAGLTIITGPTGAGKSTTWYGIVNEIDKEKNNIMSIEKPIESMVCWIHQTEEDIEERDANHKNESYTIRDGIKSALRQALHLLIVGEMRDKYETADTTSAGLVGNKVITTYHTNSSVDTILRMQTEEISRNKIANGVKFVTAQRLVRWLCPHCSIPDPESEKVLNSAKKAFAASQRQLQYELRNILESVPESRFTLDDLEIVLERQLKSISPEDVLAITTAIRERESEFRQLGSKEEKIGLILSSALPYPNRQVREFLADALSEPKVRMANPDGCLHKDCRKWYRGRVGVYEVLKFNKAVRRYINDASRPIVDMEDFLVDQGFVTMRMYGYLLTIMGITSHEDISAVIED